ncbi:MAG: hypothetical protein ABSA45_01250 [Verrucomicrobiota bacterium]|jgi:hypothetical protein
MSRINDALKRAQRAQQKHPPPADTPMPRLLPVESKSGSVIGWILPGVIGFLIVAACLFIGMALITRTVTKVDGNPRLSVVQPVTPAPIPAPIPAPAAPPPSSLPSQSPPPPPPAEPKLQGIVYATTRPWAIVNGQTVHVGDRLGEFRVKEISRRSVTLEKTDGSQKNLGLDR